MEQHVHCHSEGHGKKIDLIFWGSLVVILGLYGLYYLPLELPNSIMNLSNAIHAMVGKVWWGILFGIFMVGLLSHIPKELVMRLLGSGTGVKGIVRATIAGFLFDLCNHGIIIIGTKLYERGASLGQMMAFLISSPWNSFSLTFIMLGLIGLKWTLAVILLSAVIAIVSGVIFDRLVARGVLPENPNKIINVKNTISWRQFFSSIRITPRGIVSTFKSAIQDSKMVLRWILFGIVLTALIQTFVHQETFQSLFAPTLIGLGVTLFFATILEVCSEGSMPIAADILMRANAPGNAFTFLMAGVSTDYTEIMAVKEATKSWKIALFLPLVTLPQILIIALILNG